MRQKVLNGNGKAAPATLVVQLFGEARAAEIGGVGIDAVRKWRRRTATGGKGGLVPDDKQQAYLDAAAAAGLPLAAADLIADPY